MKKKLALLLCIALFFQPVIACTTFVLKTSNGLFFGRNLDWVSSQGIVIVNQRGLSKSSFVFPPEKPIAWVSKYGSVSFNQFGKEFPYGGMNEKGLVVEIMVSEAEYPKPDERPMVNELQWIQYQLDNCSNVEEVLATNTHIRIGQAHENLHYLVCDAAGNVAVIEFLNGQMVHYEGNELPVPVLENESYENSMRNYNSNSQCRFTNAASLIKKYNGITPGVKYAFNILQEVALTAEWSIVYDITKRQIHFRTSSNENIRVIDMASFDLDCTANTLCYDLDKMDKGSVNAKFKNISFATNSKVLKNALEINAVSLDITQINELLAYFEGLVCEK